MLLLCKKWEYWDLQTTLKAPEFQASLFPSGNLMSLVTYGFILYNPLTTSEYLLANVNENKYGNLSFQGSTFLLSRNKAVIQTAEALQRKFRFQVRLT